MFGINLDTLTDELIDGERLDLWFEQVPNTITLVLSWKDCRHTGQTLRINRVFDLGGLDNYPAPDALVHNTLIAMLDEIRSHRLRK